MDVRVSWRLLSAGVVLVFFTTHVHCCPSVCQCTSKNGQNTTVDCSGLNLLHIPANLPIETTELDLSNNFIEDLDHVFQDDTVMNVSGFLHLKNLKCLSMSNNAITTIPEGIFLNLSMLNRLDISNNDIGDINDKMFIGLQNLNDLNLSGNKDLEITNITFHFLTSLVSLDLSKTGISPDSLWIPSTVQSLRLAGNNWDTFNTSILNNLHDMNSLDLSANNLTVLDEHAFPPLHSLNILNISRNNIYIMSPRAFSAMPNLQVLIVDYNPISEITGPVFQPLSHLQYLSLSHMPNLFYLNKNTFSRLRSLSSLQMSTNPKLEFIHVSLFADLVNAKLINMSNNNISTLHPITFSMMDKVTIDIHGNYFPCNCGIEWMLQPNESNINITDVSNMGCYDNNKYIPTAELTLNELHCGELSANTNSTKLEAKIASSVILNCDWKGNPTPTVTWVTPRGINLVYFGSHPLVWKSHPTKEDVMDNGIFHMDHPWHNSTSYQSDLIEYSERIVILSNGDLFIDYMLRSDSGPYKCIVENSRNSTSVEISLRIDQSVLTEVKLWSLLIGLACAASFFMLNLLYVVISALVRRCINQRRRDAILKLVENIDQYKSAQLARLKDNYYSQLNRIRDGYHNQLERIRDNYSSQAIRFKEGASQKREWASHKLDTIRENYNSQVTRLKENSAQKLEQLRDTYNNQLLKIRDYGSAQMTRIHKKYKLQQRHVIKLLETMNFDNCRQIIDTECVRTESMIFETNLIHPDLSIPSPTLSDSDLEYHTASSNNDTPISSQMDLRQNEEALLLTSSQVTEADSSQLMGNNSDHITEDDSSPTMGDNSSQTMGDTSDEDVIDEMYDCNEIDQMLVQIQLIDESDDEESNENSRNIETCV